MPRATSNSDFRHLRIDRKSVFCQNLNPMKNLLILLVLTLVAVSLSACNTIKGAGQDVSAVGRDVSAGAQAVQKKL